MTRRMTSANMTTTWRPGLRTICLSLMLVGALVSASGCVYRLTILQGNFLEAKDLDRVTEGMTRVQVRALLGTPMVADPFQSSRWDYVYYYKLGHLKKSGQSQFTVYFEDDKVVRIERTNDKTPRTIEHPVERPIETKG
jgi:outer membrane protein assembly factor BamE